MHAQNCRAPHWLIALAAIAFLLISAPAPAGGPNITSDLTMVINFPMDHWTGMHGPHLQLTMFVSHPNGPAAFQGPLVSATAENLTNNNYPFPNPTPLPQFFVNTLDQGFLAMIPITAAQLPLIESRYRYRVTDAFGQDDLRNSHNLNRPEIIEIPTNLQVSNQTTTPVFSFTDPQPDPVPAGLFRVYNMLIIEKETGNNLALVPPLGQSVETPVVAVPAGMLCPCREYYLRGQIHDIDNGEDAVENMAVQDLLFTPFGPTPTGDLSGDCKTNGRDIQPFVDAVIVASTVLRHRCAGDFSGNAVLDAADVPGFVAKLLSP